METVRERLMHFIKCLKIPVSEFERKIEVSNAYVRNISKSMQPEILERISNVYPMLNIEWLIIGRGDMLVFNRRPKGYIPPYLLHYTRFKNLLGILRTMRLNFSSVNSGSKDLSERSFISAFPLDIDNIKEIEREIEHVRILSFCEGHEGLRGIDKPRMWAQYAENDVGVCIELNTIELIKKNNFINDCIFPVIYESFISQRKERSVRDELKYKHKDFEQESEYRIIYNGLEDGIDIKGCVTRIYTCMGVDGIKNNVNSISNVISEPNNKCYKEIMSRYFWNVHFRKSKPIFIQNNQRGASVAVELEEYKYSNKEYDKYVKSEEHHYPFIRTLEYVSSLDDLLSINEYEREVVEQEKDDVMAIKAVVGDLYRGKTVPLIPIDAVAGYGDDVDGVAYKDCDQYMVPEFEERGVEFLIRVSGSSMYPKYSSGDVLACKKIYDVLFFQWGKIYVIDSSQGQLVKRVFEDKENPDNIICVSDNGERYPPFKMPKSDIRSLSIVLGVVRLE